MSRQYSVFSTTEKRSIIVLVAYAAWFSTTSSFIYYPAIPIVSKTLGVAVDKIKLIVTSYMAVATITPTLVGDTSNQVGRRPVYIVILSIYTIVCIVIALVKPYSILVGVGVLQALAISGTCLSACHRAVFSGRYILKSEDAYGIILPV